MEKNILNKLNKNKKRNYSAWFLVLFAVLFAAVVGNAFVSRGELDAAVDVVSNEPVEMTFSDV